MAVGKTTRRRNDRRQHPHSHSHKLRLRERISNAVDDKPDLPDQETKTDATRILTRRTTLYPQIPLGVIAH